MGTAREERWNVEDRGFSIHEPTTGVRRRSTDIEEPVAEPTWRVAGVTSARSGVMLVALVAAIGIVAVPFEAARWAAVIPLAFMAILTMLFTCRAVALRQSGVAIVFDEDDEQLVAWADIQGVTRRRLGATETLVLSLSGGERKVRMRLVTSNHAGVDALEAAIKRTIDAA